MSSNVPLQGMDLISCAQANIKQGTQQTAALCGYGQNIQLFIKTLEQACQEIGVTLEDLSDSAKSHDPEVEAKGVIVAPDSLSEL